MNKKSNRKILVTGSSGQLGREIVTQLRLKKYDVLGIDITKSETTKEIVDIRDKSEIHEITKGISAIIHTAALHGKHYELNYPREEFLKTNINGTYNLLESCVKHGIKKFIYTSTTSIYGNAMVGDNQAVWVDEKLVPQPRDIYDITKQTCESLCRDYFQKERIDITVLRVSRFLPEDENTKAIHRLYRGLDEVDGAAAHILALEKKFDSFEIYNISNESPFKKEDLLGLYKNPKTIICKYYPEAANIFLERGWNFPQKIDRVYSIEKAKRELGYRPQMNFSTFISNR